MNDSGAAVHVIFFKRILLLFWAVWLSVVFLSNLADAAKRTRMAWWNPGFSLRVTCSSSEYTARHGRLIWSTACCLPG